MIRVGLSGALGRMGRIIGSLVLEDRELELTLVLEKEDSPGAGEDYGQLLGKGNVGLELSTQPGSIKEIDVLIDFSTPQATLKYLDYCRGFKKPAVVGTTGFSEREVEKIKTISKEIPVLFSPNMSVGINLLFRVIREAGEILKKDYDVEVIDIHHRYKKDAPSGTAKKFQSILRESYGRDMPVHSLRIGEVFGDHYIIFSGNNERIEFIHRAVSREVFAKGAIKACKFIVSQGAGLYSMQDIISV